MEWFRFFKEMYKPGVVIDRTRVMTLEADILRDLVSRWGLIAAIPDGEDSAGRSKFRLQTPDELVDRATRTTELIMESIVAKKWFQDIPEELE